MRIGEFYEFFRWYVKKGDGPPLMLVGLPGIGRRSVVRQVADEFGLEVVEVEPYEEPILDPESIFLIHYSPSMKLNFGYRHLVLFDYDFKDEAIDEWVPPVHDLLLIRVEASLHDWKGWAYKNNVRSEVISFLNYKPENFVRVLTLNSKSRSLNGDFSDPLSYYLLTSTISNKKKIISPKIWKFVSDVLNLKESVQKELILSSLGRIIGGDFLKFLEVYRAVKNGKRPSSEEEWYSLLGIILDELRRGETFTLRAYWKELPDKIRSILYSDVSFFR